MLCQILEIQLPRPPRCREPRLKFRRSGKASSSGLFWQRWRQLFCILASFAAATLSSAQISLMPKSLEMPSELASLSSDQILALLDDRLIFQIKRANELKVLSDAQALRLTSLESSLPMLEQKLSDSETVRLRLSQELSSSQVDLASSRLDLEMTRDSLQKSEDDRLVLQDKIDASDKAVDNLIKDYEARLVLEKLKSAAWKIGGIAVGVVVVTDIAIELLAGKSLLALIRGH
jgi:hypothetical protein